MSVERTADITLDLARMDGCECCMRQVHAALAALAGVRAAEVDARRQRVNISYDPALLSAERLRALAVETQAEVETRIRHDSVPVEGMDCADCALVLERGLGRLPGMLTVRAQVANGRVAVEYEHARLEPTAIAERVRELGYQVPAPAPSAATAAATTLRFAVEGMDCADCATSIERQVERVPGVTAARVHLMAATLAVDLAPTHAAPVEKTASAVEQAVREAGYAARPVHEEAVTRPSTAPRSLRERTARLLPTLLAAALWVVAFGVERFGPTPVVANGIFAAAIVLGGYRIARGGYLALVRGRTLGIDLLMTVAVVGAALIGQWAEGAAVVVLFSLGEALEGLTMDRARGAIRALMDLTPRVAALKTPEGERRVPVEALLPGQHILVRPGERVAADGVVVAGETAIDEATITGESLPVEKGPGADVFAGTVNVHGFVEVEVRRAAQDTTLARIITLVEDAQAARAPAQRFVDAFARIYTPAILVVAVLVALVPPLLGQPLLPWIARALVLLVIACPCALVISTPVAIAAGIARASRSGVLIKGGAYLEVAGRVRALAFDKTGTLTHGRPSVTDVLPLGTQTAERVLALAAAVESRSEHPLARAIVREARLRAIAWEEPERFEALPGRGAVATLAGQRLSVGGPRLFSQLEPSVLEVVKRLQQEGKTALLVAEGETVQGVIAVADELRGGAPAAVAALRAAGIAHVVMLTGDNARTAAAVAARLGIDEVRADLLPEEKVNAVSALLREHGSVAMVGDGVNDAPALARATLGIAMGAAGSDAALETADVALMSDDLAKLPLLLRLSRRTWATIRANVAFSLGVKALFLALTLVGVTNLWLAILADTGAALLVIAYSMRLLASERT